MDEQAVRNALRAACEQAGGQKAWCDANGVSPQYVSDFLNERRQPGERILAALGYKKVITYQKVRTT